MAAWALYYRRERGWSVFPVHGIVNGRCTCGNNRCNRPGKHPAISSWAPYQVQPPSIEQIQIWWQQNKSWNIGLATGAVSGVVVLDEDGDEGREEIARLGGVPETPTSETGKGHHIYFRHPGGALKNFVRRVPGLDFRGDGGFAILPPSRHASGQQYQWLIDLETPLADPPQWLLDLLHRSTNSAIDRTPAWVQQAMMGVEEGQRNNTATRLVGYFLRTMDTDTVRTMLHSWNRSNRPPMSEDELNKVIDSVAKREAESRIAARNFTIEAISAHVVTNTQEQPIYHVRVNGIEIVLNDRELFNYQSFRRVALWQLGFIPKMKHDTQKEWIEYLNKTLADAPLETVYLPEEASTGHQLWEAIRHELSRRTSTDESLLANRQGALLRDGRLYVNLPWLHRLLQRNGVRALAREVWEQLEAHGAETAWTHAKDEAGRRHTVRVVVLPASEVLDAPAADAPAADAPAADAPAADAPAADAPAAEDKDGEVF